MFKAISLLLFLPAAFLYAQISGGSIVGNVADPKGLAVAKATVRALNQETNEVRETATNAAGYYEFPLLPPGKYRLEAVAEGFERSRGEVFELFSGTRPRIDLGLKIGSVTETVNVDATAPLLNTTTTELGVVMARNQIDELPLNGRNFQDLVGLQAGMVNGPSSGAGGRGGISFHGSTALGTNLLLDGVDMSFGEVNGASGFASAGGGSTLVNGVSVEAIEEFKSSANATSAEFGRAGGGVLSIITRSGTNKFHGTLFEFFRNDKLNANDFFSNKNSLPKSPLRWNQFGGNVGGPVKRDKVFFFFNYEGGQVKKQAQITGTVPTPYFLSLLPAPVSKVLSFMMPTTFTPSSTVYAGTHLRNDQQRNAENTYLAKVDAIFSRQRLSGRYSYNNQTYTSPNLEPSMPTTYPLRSHNTVVEDTYTFGPAAFNDFRIGFNRVDLNRNPAGYENIPAYLSIQGISASLPNFIHFLPTTYSIADNFTLIRGSHSLKMGLDLREVRSVRVQGGPPVYTYTTYADAINSNPASVGLSFTTSKGQRTVNEGYYFQDDWHLSKSFQLNLGLRYEYSPPFVGGFNIATSDPFGPFIPANKQPMFAADRNDFGPRVGLVWNPAWSPKTVIRAGYALSYVMPQAIHYYDMAYISPGLSGVSTVTAADVPKQYLVYPAIQTFQTMIQNNPSLLPSDIHLSESVADFHRRDTYVNMWNFTIQRMLTSTLALQASYVGQRTDKLISVRPLNLVNPAIGQRPVPSLGQINVAENAARINFNSLEVSLTQRLWKGLNYDLYYTQSSAKGYYTPDDTITFTGNGLQDPMNIAGSTGPVEGLPKHNFRSIISYAIPGGQFKNRLLRGALGGWTLRSLAGWRGGNPLNVVSGGDYAGNGRSAGQRPDVVAGMNPYVEDHNTQIWLTPAAFSISGLQAQKRFGNLGFDALTGPSAFNMDTGLHKAFAIREGQKITLRIESFNTLNHTQFSNPTLTLNSVNFGKITGAASPRLYQAALKYVF